MRLNGYALLIGTGVALMSGEPWWACAVSAVLAHHFVKRGEEMSTQNNRSQPHAEDNA